MIGKALLHYEIRELLGRGGMGEVYAAHDTKLGRDVTLKVLPPDMTADEERLQRFEREARVAAGLNHPNIVTLHSVERDGETRFITMELVSGHTLSRMIPEDGQTLEQFLDQGLAMADALAEAHRNGITHRDLKPDNIMITAEGRLKVLDFGLAKLQDEDLEPVSDENMTLTQDVTRAGSILGTSAYMSPEQAVGKPADARSDIFSLGVILYQMAAGQKPFRGENVISVLSAILKDDPVPLEDLRSDLPPGLTHVVQHCLEKDPELRYSNASELHHELNLLKREADSGVSSFVVSPSGKMTGARFPRWAYVLVPLVLLLGIAGWGLISKLNPSLDTAETVAPAGNVVVFPFDNLGRTEDTYFAEGVIDEIVSRLTAIQGIGVISRTTALRYDREGKSLQEIADDLGVKYVLEGTIRWDRAADSVDRVRITPQLVRTDDGVNIWSGTFDRDLVDIFDVQTEIAGQVVTNIDASLLPKAGDQGPGVPTDNLEAYDLYLQAKPFLEWGMGPEESQLLRGIQLLEQAVEIDPEFAIAHARLSRAYSALFYQSDYREMSYVGKARLTADKALLLAPNLAEAHLAKALFYSRTEKNYASALAELELGRQLAPGNSEILSWTGTMRKRQGLFSEADAILQRALSLDPHNPTVLGELAVVHRALGNYQTAVEYNERGIALGATFNNMHFRALIFLSWKGALEPMRSLLEASDPSPRVDFEWATLLMRERKYDDALAKLENIIYDPAEEPYGFTKLLIMRAKLNWLREDLDTARQAANEAIPYLQELGDMTYFRDTNLAFAYALVGNRDQTLRYLERSQEIWPISRDALMWAATRNQAAEVRIVLGDLEEAVADLAEIFRSDREVSVPMIRVSPIFEPI